MAAVAWPAWGALAICCIAASTDLRGRTIPNWLTLPALVAGLAFHGLLGGVNGILGSTAAILVCFVPAYVLFARGALGGGDVKLFAALGAWLGVRDGLELELTSFVLVALFAIAATIWRGRLLVFLQASGRATLHLLMPSRFERPLPTEGSAELPMGGAILGAAVALALRGAL